MKLVELNASRYRSLREETVSFGDLNVFIGANGSGKSTVIDALRFLRSGLRQRDFTDAVNGRGGIDNLVWKGSDAKHIAISVQFEDYPDQYNWIVELLVCDQGFSVREEVSQWMPGGPPVKLLFADQGTGWWRSGEEHQVQLQQGTTACALASASADANFPARGIANFVSGWGFFDPSPFALRQEWYDMVSNRLDPHGRNLAERLFRLKESSPDTFRQIVSRTESILGIPTALDPKEVEGSFYFTQMEPGLTNPVHQVVTSAGTVRMLALMTALVEERGRRLVAIEEPENNIHPTALGEFTRFLTELSHAMQILITTHSPYLLDFLEDPSVVCVVKHDGDKGTHAVCESNASGVRKALEESGFSLGEYHQTRGFGS